MGCCGKTGRHIEDAGSMAKKYAAAGATTAREVKARLLGQPIPQWLQERSEICNACEHCTWLSRSEYMRLIVRNQSQVTESNGIESVLLSEQTLRIYPKDKTRTMQVCAVCKCWLPAAIRVPEKRCELAKWPAE